MDKKSKVIIGGLASIVIGLYGTSCLNKLYNKDDYKIQPKQDEEMNSALIKESWFGSFKRDNCDLDANFITLDLYKNKEFVEGDVTFYLSKPVVIEDMLGKIENDNSVLLFPKNDYGFNSNALQIKFINENKLEGIVFIGYREKKGDPIILKTRIGKFKATK
ncbi:MAG: hypothetical protein AB1571_02250 [Nanoarchaeota archaeon]